MSNIINTSMDITSMDITNNRFLEPINETQIHGLLYYYNNNYFFFNNNYYNSRVNHVLL